MVPHTAPIIITCFGSGAVPGFPSPPRSPSVPARAGCNAEEDRPALGASTEPRWRRATCRQKAGAGAIASANTTTDMPRMPSRILSCVQMLPATRSEQRSSKCSRRWRATANPRRHQVGCLGAPFGLSALYRQSGSPTPFRAHGLVVPVGSCARTRLTVHARPCADAAESAAAIMQSVRSQHAEEEARPDVSPDGLVYNVTAFELEVERCGTRPPQQLVRRAPAPRGR